MNIDQLFLKENKNFNDLRDSFIAIFLLLTICVLVFYYLNPSVWGLLVLFGLFLYAIFKSSFDSMAVFLVSFFVFLIGLVGYEGDQLMFYFLLCLLFLIAFFIYKGVKSWFEISYCVRFVNLLLGVAVLALFPIFLSLLISSRENEDFVPFQEANNSSVVKLLCFGEEPGFLEGSGTIISSDGLIMTNAHVFPEIEDSYLEKEQECMVLLPDPVRGELLKTFHATAVYINEENDIAYLKIDQQYSNTEFINNVDDYYFPSVECTNTNVKLGDPIRILGYPSYKGVLGYSLTVTEGIISSFPEKGIAMTSAKIESGTSGGLAIDKKGCMVGTPTFYVVGEAESLGGIVLYKNPPDFLLE
ncbi:serine protease [Patescibacteria group bacterium]|nr:serine protease [Patescibacteria group bacterium]